MINIDIKTKNIDLDAPLRQFVNEKIGSLEHLLPAGEFHAVVEIGKSTRHHRNGPFFYAECNMHMGQSNNVFRATSEDEDLRVAIVAVKDELQVQLKKSKGKRTDRSRQPQDQE